VPIKIADRALAALAVLCLVLAGCGSGAGLDDDPELQPLPIGGDFTLTGTDGQPFSLTALRGRTVLLFFGYTACPDVCPTTLGRLAGAYRELEKEGLADRVTTVFVSVDPARDTPEKIGQYLSYFAVPAVGATGKAEEVAAVAKSYAASFERVATDSAAGYLINHSTYVYLIDPVGKVRHLFRHEDPPQVIADLTARLIKSDCCGL
jgi:protein SCO1/2